jgi:hypothetical protein
MRLPRENAASGNTTATAGTIGAIVTLIIVQRDEQLDD